ncbi:hypothetical protein [Nocardia sp. NBC_00403]|uniref:hypothetical protein n=1 Tax=Nocardia sp. NBC_00403 TaxID=2975990 RepID=UPI002E1ADD55
MTAEEINAHYLMVGSDRRVRIGSDLSRRLERPVMGRRGIGKLAAFGICRTIEVVSVGGAEAERTPQGWPVANIRVWEEFVERSGIQPLRRKSHRRTDCFVSR